MTRAATVPASIRTALQLLALAGAARAAAGCAVVDGLKGNDESTDGGGVDASPDADCAAPSSMPIGMLAGGTAVRTDTFLAVFASRETVPPRDIYQLELWQDLLPFTGTIEPGQYVIEDAQTEYDTCGVCVLIYGDTDVDGFARQHYIAESGVVNIDFVDDSTISGSISTASLVSYDDGPRGACQTTVGPTPFNAVIQQQ